MRAAEQDLIDTETSVDLLMQRAGRGAAEFIWRMAAHRRVTVLCGPGNNGGDGYVIAEALRSRGGEVTVIAAQEPRTDAARNARALYFGEVLGPDADPAGEIFVDCLFGCGLSRPLLPESVALLVRLAQSHRQSIAVDVPSGVQADTGAMLNAGLPHYDLTIALGEWKFAHMLMPGSASMGELRLVRLGVTSVSGAAFVISRPQLVQPSAAAHKYVRGLLAIISGAMPGAALLAATGAQGSGAGFVKILTERAPLIPPDIVADLSPLALALGDPRITAMLIGPGLGRDPVSRKCLATALSADVSTVIDADAVRLLSRRQVGDRQAPLIATPHDGELHALEQAFGLRERGDKVDRARAAAKKCGMIIVAKGPDTVIAAPNGRIACAPRAPSWLSTAGTGDVLAGVIASRLATGAEPFDAACQGVWLHGEAARLCGPAFTAIQLAAAIPAAFAACL